MIWWIDCPEQWHDCQSIWWSLVVCMFSMPMDQCIQINDSFQIFQNLKTLGPQVVVPITLPSRHWLNQLCPPQTLWFNDRISELGNPRSSNHCFQVPHSSPRSTYPISCQDWILRWGSHNWGTLPCYILGISRSWTSLRACCSVSSRSIPLHPGIGIHSIFQMAPLSSTLRLDVVWPQLRPPHIVRNCNLCSRSL